MPMQALNTHLGQAAQAVTEAALPLQAAKYTVQGGASFEKLLQKEVFMRSAKTGEGALESGFHSANTVSRTEDTHTPAKSEAAEKTRSYNEADDVKDTPELKRPQTDEKSAEAAAESEQPEPDRQTGVQQEERKVPSAEEAASKKAAGEKNVARADVLSEEYQRGVQIETQNQSHFPDTAQKPDSVLSAKKAVTSEEELLQSLKTGEQDSGSQNLEAAAFSFVQTENPAPVKTKLKGVSKNTGTGSNEDVLPAGKLRGTAGITKELSLPEIPAITVRDERTKIDAAQEKKQGMLSSVRFDGKGNAQADVFFSVPDGSKTAPGTVLSAKDGTLSSSAQVKEQKTASFASMLSNEIRSNAADLVKTGSIILRDGNRGSINLILHPEELGNVKIRLQLSDNILTGRITVASEEAYHAFKANIASLTEAFASNGFDTTGFDLSWSGQDADGAAGERNSQEKGTPRHPFAFRYDEQSSGVDADTADSRTFESRPYVNLIA